MNAFKRMKEKPGKDIYFVIIKAHVNVFFAINNVSSGITECKCIVYVT